jgi:CRP-like cAMP-binding protein
MLLDYLNMHLNLSDELEERFDTVFKSERISKGDIILKPENISKKVFFIEQGLIRSFYIKDGKDITHLFFTEGAFFLPVESVFYNRTCPYGWEALENGEIRTTHYRDFEPFFTDVPGFEKFIRMLILDVMDTFSERLYALQFQTAHDRYKKLMEVQPDILLRAPLGHIASYLGITQQTLSVIRSSK